MAISSPGIGSGLDVNAIVRQLVAIERRPIQQLESQAGSLRTQLSAFARVRSDLAGLQDAAARLLDPSLWGSRNFSSSNSTALTGSAGSSALTSNFSVQIARLAQSQGAASTGRAVDAPIGAAGTLEFRVGTWSGNSFGGGTPVSVAVQANDTLSTLAARINESNAGVSALVLRSGGQEQLMLRGSNTGAAAGFEVRALDGGGAPITDSTSALGSLNHFHNGTALVGMGRTQDALDAQFSVDGVALTSPTNTVANVVPGLTLNLQQSTTATLPGSPATAVQVSVQQNNTVVREAIEAFRVAYNRINATLSELTRADPAGNADGPLQADGTARRLQTALRQLVMSDGPSGSPLGRLSDMGLQVQRDGSLGVNNTRLDAAMANQEGMRRLLSHTGSAGADVGIARRLRDFALAANGTEGSVNGRNSAIQASIERKNDRIERLEDRLVRTQASLLAQYSRLDANLGAINGLGSFVTQQLAQWNRSNN
ncbi:flagellar capping protein [Serpentinimonas raichei]|uniref:Flagellar hook-associated protein 2 n=1 Tax=Serpentinimonas raichei TaxID=1458425 RepID=A0A060NIE5_9BURK|nr:flagellar filament capping protein FliD [Serpentinimonas raichei]BAO80685.1 flagellar capping protein [Serpentinimonas raichei]